MRIGKMWTNGRKTSLEWSIKFTRKAMACQTGMLVINLGGIAWNWYWIDVVTANPTLGHLAWFGFGMGAFVSNFMWTFAQVARYWSDIKSEKRELEYITQLEIKEEIQNDRKLYKDGKETYEALIQKYQTEIAGLQKNKLSESYTAGHCNLGVQPASP